MIISRTPFRLSFAGGGSDLPSFFQEEEGAVLSTAINKFMYVTVNKRFDHTVRLSYSKTEVVENTTEIHHPIFKEVIGRHMPQGGIEIISMADVPAGTGLGSSSSFTVGLLHALKVYKGQNQTAENLASEACDIEINHLGEPIGKQDQYIAAYGGLQFIRFMPSGDVFVDPVICHPDVKRQLQASVLMLYTGQTRDAKIVLEDQKKNTPSKRETVREMVKIARRLKTILEEGNKISAFGPLLHEAWLLKKSMSSQVSNPQIDSWYERAMEAGALGGKILGAGSGGFLMLFSTPERRDKIKAALSDLRPFDIEFENQGSKIIFTG